MALSIDFQDSVSFLLTIQATGPLTLALAGLTLAEQFKNEFLHSGNIARPGGSASTASPSPARFRSPG
jgi:hypothetical protein